MSTSTELSLCTIAETALAELFTRSTVLSLVEHDTGVYAPAKAGDVVSAYSALTDTPTHITLEWRANMSIAPTDVWSLPIEDFRAQILTPAMMAIDRNVEKHIAKSARGGPELFASAFPAIGKLDGEVERVALTYKGVKLLTRRTYDENFDRDILSFDLLFGVSPLIGSRR